MLAITIVLFVVPHNQQIVTIRQFFTYRIPLFRNQNLNIQKSRLLDFRKLLDPPATMLNPHLEEVFEFLNYKNKERPSFSRKTIQAPTKLLVK